MQKQFCNLALSKELIKRNWYISALYIFGWILALMPTISRIRYMGDWSFYQEAGISVGLTGYLPVYLSFSALLTLLYCVVATCANCDYLFKTEAARFYGASSQKRTSLLLSSLLTTILPGLLVNVVAGALFFFVETGAGLTNCVGPAIAGSGCIMVIVMSGLCLLCASVSSSRFVFILITCMLNAYVFALDFEFLLVTDMFSYGVTGETEPSNIAFVLSPLVKIISEFFTVNGYWMWLVIYAVVAVAAIFASCMIYKYRQFETVGEGISFKKLRPVFSIAFSIAFGLTFALIGIVFVGFSSSGNSSSESMTTFAMLIIFFLIGALGSYAVVESILAKSPRILKNRLGGMAVLIVICFVSIFGAYQLGMKETNYVPSASDVEKVTVDNVRLIGETPEVIDAAIDLHKSILDGGVLGEDDNSSYSYDGMYADNSFYYDNVSFTYIMKDGSIVQRSYQLMFTRENIADTSSCQGKVASLANSELARQSRVDWLYYLAQERGTQDAMSVNYYSNAEDSENGVSVDLSLTGNDLKKLLDYSLAEELQSTSAYDPDLIGWIDEEDTYYEDGYVSYMYPEFYSYGEGETYYQICGSIRLTSEETPKSLEWITKTASF